MDFVTWCILEYLRPESYDTWFRFILELNIIHFYIKNITRLSTSIINICRDFVNIDLKDHWRLLYTLYQ